MSSSDIKDTAQQVIEGPKQFFKDGFQFINRCKKPDQQGNFNFFFDFVIY